MFLYLIFAIVIFEIIRVTRQIFKERKKGRWIKKYSSFNYKYNDYINGRFYRKFKW